MRTILLPVMLILAISPGCRRVPDRPAESREATDEELDRLLGLMRIRLTVMHDVARRKWADKTPIEDPTREAALLKNIEEKGAALGLDRAVTRAFFGAQIEASKRVQRGDFRRWEAGPDGPEGEAPDLAGVLRPRIDALNRDLLGALARTLPRLRGNAEAAGRLRIRAGEILTGDGIDGEVRAEAIRPLVGLADFLPDHAAD